MKFQAVMFALLIATAAGHSMRGAQKMQPEMVAHSLLSVEEEWRSQAASFADCNSTATDASADCSAASKAFGKSCATVVNAVVQASNGDRSVVHEYWGDICDEKELQGWRQERCNTLAAAMDKVMTDNNYDNREGLDSSKICSSFWSVFTVEEQKRLVKEKAEKEAEEKRLAEEKAAADKKAAEEEAAAEKKAAEEKAAAEKKAAEEAAAAERKRVAEEADKKAKEAKARAEDAAQKLAEKQAEATRIAEEAQKKAEEAKKIAEEMKAHQARANQTATEAEQVHKALNSSVTANASTAEANATKAENVTEAAPAPTANASQNTSTAPATPKDENVTAAENKTVAPKTENKTVSVKAANTSLIQAASCRTRSLGAFALLSQKAAALGPVCEEMCKEIGVYPKCQCPGFAGQPASADDTRACIVKYCQDASNKCPNDGFSNCVAENSKVSALQWDAVMSHVSQGFESLTAAVRMSKSKK